MTDTVRVLVLCSGNIGRSPLAAALLEHALAAELGVSVSSLPAHGIEVVSAGIEAPEGHAASRRGQAYAARRGIDISGHAASVLTSEMIDGADLIYAMDHAQIEGVDRLVPGASDRVLLWEGKGNEIPDPHHGSDEFFVAVGDRITAALPNRVREVLGFRASAGTAGSHDESG